MVGPSLSSEEQRAASLRLKVGLVLIIGASAGLIALQAQATLVQVGVAFVGGVLLGAVLVAYLVRIVPGTGR